MTSHTKHQDISFDDFDELINPPANECDFDRIVDAAIGRRGFLGGALAFGSFALLGGALTSRSAQAASRSCWPLFSSR